MQEILTNRVCVAELPKQKLDILLVKVTWNLRKLKLIRFSYGSIKDVFNLVVFNLTWQEQVIYICIAQKTKYANGDQKLKTSLILIVLCIFAPWNVFRALLITQQKQTRSTSLYLLRCNRWDEAIFHRNFRFYGEFVCLLIRMKLKGN